jgi:regulation of enolase protein 1 (concanavalin A-like superfamily)
VIDQFGQNMSAAVTWSVSGSTNQISSAGVLTPGDTSGTFSVVASAGSVTGSASVVVDASIFTGSKDIGSVALAGETLPVTNGVYTIRGAGADIWGASDAFRFNYASLTGDGEIIARVTSVGATNAWAKAGVMIRSADTANAQHASVFVTPSSGVSFQRRTSTGGSSSSSTAAGLTAPYWVKVVRVGNVFTGFRSANGTTWTRMASVTISTGTTALFGLAVCSHNTSALCTATFDNVRINRITRLSSTATATASSTASGYLPSYAIDSSTSTAWRSAAAGSQWLSIDLGSVRTAAQVAVSWGTPYAKSFRVQSSLDGVNWTDAYSTTSGTGTTLTLTGLSQSARFWRVLATVSSSTSYTITNVDVLGV